MDSENSEIDIENNEFYFESDHLALKGNKDYLALLKTIVILEAQRTQAIQDLDELLAYQAKALKDPISFVAQLQNSDLPTLPGPRKIAELPYIDWRRYSSNFVEPDTRVRPQTRHGNFTPPRRQKVEQDDDKILVRGRAFDESKPETFNQLWTAEEQRRLEELLEKYPSELVEMKRYGKIAKELGNRTAKQVASRVQKYYVKLIRAGLPLPGRGPKVRMEFRRNVHHRHHRSNYMYFRKSTFFPHHTYTDDDKDDPLKDPLAVDSSDDTNVEDTPEQRQIELLRQIKTEKQTETEPVYRHFGYKCKICGEDPLRGSRWNCIECHDVNLCSDCVVAQMDAINPAHPPSHKLIHIETPDNLRNYDTDYYSQNFVNSTYNYLDPNFLPE